MYAPRVAFPAPHRILPALIASNVAGVPSNIRLFAMSGMRNIMNSTFPWIAAPVNFAQGILAYSAGSRRTWKIDFPAFAIAWGPTPISPSHRAWSARVAQNLKSAWANP